MADVSMSDFAALYREKECVIFESGDDEYNLRFREASTAERLLRDWGSKQVRGWRVVLLPVSFFTLSSGR